MLVRAQTQLPVNFPLHTLNFVIGAKGHTAVIVNVKSLYWASSLQYYSLHVPNLSHVIYAAMYQKADTIEPV